MITKLYSWMYAKPHHVVGLRVLRSFFGVFILFRLFTEGRFAAYFWGPAGVGQGTETNIFGAFAGGYLNMMFQTMTATYFLLGLLFLGAMGFVMNKLVLWSNIVLLIVFWSLEQRFPFLADGGDNITRLVLFFLLFTLTDNTKKYFWARVWIHNLAVITIILQLVILYTVSGLLKATGEKWTSGVALYHISQVDWFSNPDTRFIFKIPIITTIMCYGTVFFQIYFPIAIFTRFRMLWIFLGILLHLSIAYTMGLYTFSCAMIGLEFFLIRDKEFQSAQNYLATKFVIIKQQFYGKYKNAGKVA